MIIIVSLIIFCVLAPSSPRNVIVTSINATAVRITWTEPAMTNGIIRNYTISVSTSHNRFLSEINQMDLSITVLGLNHDTEYVVNITAVTIRPGEPEVIMFTTRPCKSIITCLMKCML